jgi:hypothetical protein
MSAFATDLTYAAAAAVARGLEGTVSRRMVGDSPRQGVRRESLGPLNADGPSPCDPKWCWAGVEERKRLLKSAGIQVPTKWPGGRAGGVEVLDAGAAAWTALPHPLGAGTDGGRQ